MEPDKVLVEVAREVSTCPKCDLQFSRKKAVPGEGPADAQIMFIGEDPGFNENEQGRPFVGAAGNFPNELLDQAEGRIFRISLASTSPGMRGIAPSVITMSKSCGRRLNSSNASTRSGRVSRCSIRQPRWNGATRSSPP